jgi:hypothetical protein
VHDPCLCYFDWGGQAKQVIYKQEPWYLCAIIIVKVNLKEILLSVCLTHYVMYTPFNAFSPPFCCLKWWNNALFRPITFVFVWEMLLKKWPLFRHSTLTKKNIRGLPEGGCAPFCLGDWKGAESPSSPRKVWTCERL